VRVDERIVEKRGAFVDLRLRADQRQRAASAASAACCGAAASRRARSCSAARTHTTAIEKNGKPTKKARVAVYLCVRLLICEYEPTSGRVLLQQHQQHQQHALEQQQATKRAPAMLQARTQRVMEKRRQRTDRRKPDIRQHIFYNRWAIHGVPPAVDMC